MAITDKIPANPDGVLAYVEDKLNQRTKPDDTVVLKDVFTLTSDISQMLRDQKVERLMLNDAHVADQGSVAELLKKPTSIKLLSVWNIDNLSDEDIDAIAHFLLESPVHAFHGTKKVEDLIEQKKDIISQGGGIDAIQLTQAIETANAQKADVFEYTRDTLPSSFAEKLTQFSGKRLSLSNITTMSATILSTLLKAQNLQTLSLPSVRTLDTLSLKLLADFEVTRRGHIEIHPDMQRAYLEEKANAFDALGDVDPVEEARLLSERIQRLAKAYNEVLTKNFPDTEDFEIRIASLFNMSETSFHWDDTHRTMMIKAEFNGVPGYLIFPSPLGVGTREMGPLAYLYGIQPQADVRRTGIMDPAWVPQSILEDPQCNFDISKLPSSASSDIHFGNTAAIPGPVTRTIPTLVIPANLPPPLPTRRDITKPVPFVPFDTDTEKKDDTAVPEDPLATIRDEIRDANFNHEELNILTNDNWLDVALTDVITDATHGYRGERLILSRVVDVEPGMLARVLVLPKLTTLSIPKVEKLDAADLIALKAFKDRGGVVIASQAIEDIISTSHVSTDPGEIRIMEKKSLDQRLQYFRGLTAGVEGTDYFFEGAREDIERSFDTLQFAIDGLLAAEKDILKNIIIRLNAKQSSSDLQYLHGKKVAFQICAGKPVEEVLQDLHLIIQKTSQFNDVMIRAKQAKKQLPIADFIVGNLNTYIPEELFGQIVEIEDAIKGLPKAQARLVKTIEVLMRGSDDADYFRISVGEAPWGLGHDFTYPQNADQIRIQIQSMLDQIAATPKGQKMLKEFTLPSLPTLPALPKLPSLPKFTLSEGQKNIAKKVAVALTAATVGSIGAYEILKTPESPALITVPASKVPSKEALPTGAIVTFTSFEEAVEKEYFVQIGDEYEIADGFMLANPSLKVNSKSPQTFQLKKIGVQEIE